ncbi:MAG: formylglycine-generating enzyme family protein, partial [Gammaproteobacteria bacterium]
GYWLADTVCTQALWEEVMGRNPSASKGPDRPVENVTWNDTQKFIEKINSELPGLSLRLPSEAEWEYACRAGTMTPFSFGANISPDQVNYHGRYPYAGASKGLYRGETLPVTSLDCNDWGLYEMHGNVWEWCQDWYGEYNGKSVTDPTGPSKGMECVLRGGGWNFDARRARSASRDSDEPGLRNDYIGFRLSRGRLAGYPGEAKKKTRRGRRRSKPSEVPPWDRGMQGIY